MNSRSFRRTVAVAGAGAILSITTASASTASVQQDRDQQGTAKDRPCFMVRASWNTALDGPQPTCPVPTGQQASVTDTAATGAARPVPAPRVTDYLP